MWTCVVNSAGPVSGLDVGNYSDPRYNPDPAAPPIIVLTLTDTGNSFNSQWFVVPSGSENYMLAVALAAISTGSQVAADVDWPLPVITIDNDGNPVYGPPFCHLLWINAG